MENQNSRRVGRIIGRRAERCQRHVVKPYLEREGHGVRFSRELSAVERRRLAHEDVVYQREVRPSRLAVPVATARGWRAERRVLVVGVFLTGQEVTGVYTRAGAPITGREAVFVPLMLS